MPFDLPSLQRTLPIVEEDRTPSFAFHVWWDKFKTSIENSISNLADVLATVTENTEDIENLQSGKLSQAQGDARYLKLVGGDLTGTLQIKGGTLGYGTGVGGSVTQATSRTTGVTLNKVVGAITLVSAAGSASWQTFTVTNSVVAATDIIIVEQKSGSDKNMIFVTAIAAGSFDITFATTGGTTVEQPVFNFLVLKGFTS